MTVLVLTAVPPSLRGVLTRWLFEIAPGVFVGHVSVRVRDLLWERVVDGVGRGRAILVHSARNEQRLAFRVHGHDWTPVDFDGLELMLRPGEGEAPRAGQTSGRSSGTGTGARPAAGTVRAPVRAPEASGAGGVNAPRNWSFAERRLRPSRPRRPAAAEGDGDGDGQDGRSA